MDHPSAHERLADLALEPARLAELEADHSDDAVALRAHLSTCAECASDLAGWRRTYATLALATGTGQGGSGHLRDLEREQAPAPPELRDRVMRQVTGPGTAAAPAPEGAVSGAETAAPNARLRVPPTPTGSANAGGPAPTSPPKRRSRPKLAWLAVAAALVIAVVSSAVALERDQQLGISRAEVAELASVAGTLDRILAEPTHDAVPLRAADGSVGGLLAWSTSELAVVTSILPPPADGATYRCWVERGGTRTVVGVMSFAGGTGYWAGSTGPWGGGLSAGDRFGVSLAPADGSVPSPVLAAQL
jgi:hypothetical protein